ncbi:hypothetical protein BY996DRAFT_6624242 [Phakopsora pachyrhizi]|nr:hypothetical protein BY996DRAFT_6624242 [Phakopsora pachyrhizi]
MATYLHRIKVRQRLALRGYKRDLHQQFKPLIWTVLSTAILGYRFAETSLMLKSFEQNLEQIE